LTEYLESIYKMKDVGCLELTSFVTGHASL